MAAQIMSLTYVDKFGKTGSFQVCVKAGLPATDAELLTMIQEHLDMSQAQLLKASLIVPIDISGLTNPAAVDTGAYDRIGDQAILQGRKEDGSSFVRITVPAPVDALFVTAGGFAQQDVDETSAPVAAFLAAALSAAVAGEIWRACDDDLLNYSKGWRKGQPHS